MAAGAFFFSATPFLFGEIQEVTVRWDGRSCWESCQEGLKRAFQKIPGVAEVQMSQGQALLRWKPQSGFSFQQINSSVRLVGVPFQGIWLKVRGTVRGAGGRMELVSLGDNTVFTLMSPMQVAPNKTMTPQSLQSYRLDDKSQQQLAYNEQTYRLVTVSGRLFHPYNSPPNYLIIEQLEAAAPPQPIAPTGPAPKKGYYKPRPTLQELFNNNVDPQVQMQKRLVEQAKSEKDAQEAIEAQKKAQREAVEKQKQLEEQWPVPSMEDYPVLEELAPSTSQPP